MASEQPVGAGAPHRLPRAARPLSSAVARPFYADPLRILGWAVALAALLAYWWLFARPRPLPPGAPTARLTGLAGRVRVRPNAAEAWIEARLAMALHVGDAVRTDPESGAQISFEAGSVVRVRPDSIVFVGGTAESSTTAWRLNSGRVNFAVGAQGAEIETPSARTRAQANASGQLDVTDAGTGLKIFRGAAELQTRIGQSMALAANQAVQVDAAGRLGARLELPPAPALVAPSSRVELPFASPPAAVATLRWTDSRGASTYRVALDFNVTQADLLLAAALDVPGIAATEHELTGMDPGRYFWRVAGVTADGIEGEFSRVSLFTVLPRPAPSAPAAAPPAAELRLEPPQAVAPGVVRVSGRAEPGAAVTIAGVPVTVQPDGAFGEYVRVPSSGLVVVRSTAGDGRVREQTLRVGGR